MIAIALINTPSCCDYCVFQGNSIDNDLDEYEMCRLAFRECEYNDHRPTWCPLVAMPLKLDTYDVANRSSKTLDDAEQYVNGWNDCIDHIRRKPKKRNDI